MFSTLNDRLHYWFLGSEAYETWEELKNHPENWKIECKLRHLTHEPSGQQFYIGAGSTRFNAIVYGNYGNEHSLIGTFDRLIVWRLVKAYIKKEINNQKIKEQKKYHKGFKLNTPNKR